MNKFFTTVIMTVIVVVAILLAVPAHAGALTHPAAIGTDDVLFGGDPDGIWVFGNLGARLQLRDQTVIDVGSEVMVPKFSYTNRFGCKFESKSVAHPLPSIFFATHLNEDVVGGIDIHTLYGLGATFPAINWGMDTKTLVAGSYINSFITRRLTDKLFIGSSFDLVFGQLSWDAPFDIDRVPLPIMTKTDMYGIGVGSSLGLWWQPFDSFGCGLNYRSKVEVDLKGRTQILTPFGRIRDKTKGQFQFPDKLDFAFGWSPAEDWLITGDFSFVGYSKLNDNFRLEFDKLGFTKPVRLAWQDHIIAHLGVSRRINDHWLIGGGVGYMGKSIPDRTVDMLTPDVEGLCAGARIVYQADNFNLTASITRSWGENDIPQGKIEADIWVFGLSGTLKF